VLGGGLLFTGAPPGISSVNSRCSRFRACALAPDSSSRRSHNNRSTVRPGSAASSRSLLSRSATITIACASAGSVLRPCPVSDTRARLGYGRPATTLAWAESLPVVRGRRRYRRRMSRQPLSASGHSRANASTARRWRPAHPGQFREALHPLSYRTAAGRSHVSEVDKGSLSGKGAVAT
jgi:hypothetical protein